MAMFLRELLDGPAGGRAGRGYIDEFLPQLEI